MRGGVTPQSPVKERNFLEEGSPGLQAFGKIYLWGKNTPLLRFTTLGSEGVLEEVSRRRRFCSTGIVKVFVGVP